MTNSTGFSPIAKPNATILILGSMPGQKSLDENQYYAHPRNSFWLIMCQLFNADKDLSYEQRKQLLHNNKVAVWDVLKSCYRQGSLDSDIDTSTIETNNFKSFFKTHSRIKAVFFNGTKSEQLFNKEVFKSMESSALKYHKLPSTSPAHAAMTIEEKILKWGIIKNLINSD